MSTSAVTLTKIAPGSSIDQKTIEYFFNLTVGAGSYTTNGIPISFAGLVHAPGAPIEVRMQSQGVPPTEYTYQYNPTSSPSQTAGLLKISTGGTEISATTTPSGVTGDTILCIAKFLRG
jgi:hypothetical protein